MSSKRNHSIPSGDLVSVYITEGQDRTILEGYARIIAPFGDEPHVHLVQFENEALPQVRYVRPEQYPDDARAAHDIDSVPPSTSEATPPRGVTHSFLPMHTIRRRRLIER